MSASNPKFLLAVAWIRQNILLTRLQTMYQPLVFALKTQPGCCACRLISATSDMSISSSSTAIQNRFFSSVIQPTTSRHFARQNRATTIITSKTFYLPSTFPKSLGVVWMGVLVSLDYSRSGLSSKAPCTTAVICLSKFCDRSRKYRTWIAQRYFHSTMENWC